MAIPTTIQMEFSADKLGELILNRARTQVNCMPAPITLINPNDGILDHIEFDDGVELTLSPTQASQSVRVAGGGQATVQTSKLRIRLSFHIFIKLISEAQDPDVAPDHYWTFFPTGLSATLSLELSMTGSPAALCVEVLDWKPSIDLGKEMHDKVLGDLQAAGPLCVPFDASIITGVLGSVKSQSAVLVVVRDPGGSVISVAVVIEIGNAPQMKKAEWQSLVDGLTSSLAVVGPDWNVTIPGKVLAAEVASRFESGMAQVKDITIDGPATGEWSAPGAFGGGTVEVHLDSHVSLPECPNDIGVHLYGKIDLDLTINELVEHIYADWVPDDGDVDTCGATFGGPIGALIGGLVAGPIGAVVGALIGVIIGAVVAGVVASAFAGSKSLKGNVNQPGCTVVDDHHFTCTTLLDLPSLDFGGGIQARLKANEIKALDAALQLGGTVWAYTVGNPWFDMQLSDDTDKVVIGRIGSSCSPGPGYAFTVELTGSAGAPSGPPTTLCYADTPEQAVEIFGDTYNLYPLALESSAYWLPDMLPFGIPLIDGTQIDETHPYFQHPYRPVLYVRTSSGSHAIRLPELVLATPPTLQEVLQAINEEIAQCHQLAAGWLGDPGRFDPHWLIDPGPETDLNIWDFMVQISSAGDQVSVRSNEGRSLANGIATDQTIQLSVATDAAGGHAGSPAPIAFARTVNARSDGSVRASGLAAADQRAQLFIAQRSFRWMSSWSALGGELRRVRTSRYQGRQCVIISSRDGVEIVSVDTPAIPSLIRAVSGAVGALPLYRGLLAWSRGGLTHEDRSLLDVPVQEVVILGAYLYALTARDIVVFDEQLDNVGSVATDGARHLVGSGPRLIAGYTDHIQVFDLERPMAPRSGPKLGSERLQGLESPPLSEPTQSVLVESEGDQYAIVYTGGERPYVAAKYLVRPWFKGADILDDIMVRPTDAGGIDIFIAGKRAVQSL
jgi:hypothetical protein